MSGNSFHSIKLCSLPLMVNHHHPEIFGTHRHVFCSHPSSNLLRAFQTNRGLQAYSKGYWRHRGQEGVLLWSFPPGHWGISQSPHASWEVLPHCPRNPPGPRSAGKPATANKVFRTAPCSFRLLRLESKGYSGQNTKGRKAILGLINFWDLFREAQSPSRLIQWQHEILVPHSMNTYFLKKLFLLLLDLDYA